jgi:hypothetical protein
MQRYDTKFRVKRKDSATYVQRWMRNMGLKLVLLTNWLRTSHVIIVWLVNPWVFISGFNNDCDAMILSSIFE